MSNKTYKNFGYAGNGWLWLFWISWLVFVANICFCLLPYMFRDGSFIGLAAFSHDQLFYQFGYMPRIITSLFVVGFLSYTSGSIYATAVWSFLICFIATTARYTQAGFSAANASDAWKFFGITFAIFIAVRVICRKLG